MKQSVFIPTVETPDILMVTLSKDGIDFTPLNTPEWSTDVFRITDAGVPYLAGWMALIHILQMALLTEKFASTGFISAAIKTVKYVWENALVFTSTS